VGKGAKIAIGCAVVVFVVGGVVAVFLGVGAYWLKGKAETGLGELKRTADDLERYQKEANANAFTRPADGAFAEDRLLEFLEVRKQVYAVYQLHRADFEGKKAPAGVGDLLRFGGLVAEVKVAQEKAQAAVGMSDEEYLFMVQAVYGAAIGSTMQKETGKTAPQAMGEAMDQYKEAMRAASEAARKAGASPANPADLAEAERQMDQARQGAAAVFAAPQSNIDLYRKHEADIKKYAMEGLALIGL